MNKKPPLKFVTRKKRGKVKLFFKNLWNRIRGIEKRHYN